MRASTLCRGASWNGDADMDVVGSSTMALAENGDIYIAYANQLAGADKSHVNVSYFDVSEQDMYVWHNGINDWSNDLTAPSTFSDSLDGSDADGKTSHTPQLTATSAGIYLSYLYQADESNDHLYFTRIGSNDSDQDGVTDSADAFPFDPTETVDTDGDGIGNNADTDDDNDGALDIYDAYPLDSSRSVVEAKSRSSSGSVGGLLISLLLMLMLYRNKVLF